MQLTDARVALISGASRGIGAAIAKRLFEAGWGVSLGMRAPVLPDWAQAAPERVHLFSYDARSPEAATNWAEAAQSCFGRIDAVIANAGVMVPKNVIEISDPEMADMLAINVQAPQRLAKACWDGLKSYGRGRVIVLASLSGKRVKGARSGAYAMTKFAAVGLAHALRHTGFEDGIRATAVCPGFVATDMGLGLSDRAAAAMTQPEDLARIIEMLIDLPNEASVAEFCVNCQLEESF
ncbi:NADP-dependent 3-hydroxy acid dehydrogenase YdfG [Rhodobacter aestuarii]|uniref:NADP-dependent 3-hydroxy acid dehydrogenase YdfG n=1 Tax=Rhodobacter aestuarii TaxID=453582 RepID=A0A1N7L175_9RHOB|nr:SDR family NAD(P)-dependent oxidoreductase [Rhodobacter aestuarii]PTV95446.1 NADP-dependent 3-hydroxy acid dehydrogenase YdfG [Rhodobacter aestuarii]SIS67612.1 NADP-dependent 3-hydroxy acid dehydrogenase YdfG [Rhodobacter aestuarii]